MRQGNEVALLYPATSPKKVPTAAAKTMAMSATDKEFCPPTSMRLSRSRPRRSVPNGCARLEPARGQGGA